ncbi:hypothetical protein [Thalassotalea crassostreae]|uniref:pyroglutamyl-peptidase I family protein n=1 Tax=Thalassotalea crassostreae TaxID=1763536 RepID=UPI000838AE45|nr:hypothetical protein [Thalassotalea crassostreae]
MKKIIIAATLFVFLSAASANSNTYVNYEELKQSEALKQIPKVSKRFEPLASQFITALQHAKSEVQLAAIILQYGDQLWQQATTELQDDNYDDRSLYWARLYMTRNLRSSKIFHQLSAKQQTRILFDFELASRGTIDIHFTAKADKKILITGFDPFYLHRNIGQSNPSGVAAMYLDGKIIEHKGVTAEIQSLIIPVRFADFDQGMIETMLTPYFKSADVDMISTISMGRTDFDLERFPGKRRSSVAPGNLGVYSGANAKNPIVPFLNGEKLQGPEFVEFSLPVTEMLKATGKYKINDNHKVQTLEKDWFEAKSLAELEQQTSVNGGGGGYLSNEISYRSILLRNRYNPTLPVGHIHTPRIKDWDKEVVKEIVIQIEKMLTLSVNAI